MSRSFDDTTILAAWWREHDVARAVHADDRRAIAGSEAPRALVLELLAGAGRQPRDLYSACARLGRLLGDVGASPTLAATTLDGALQALARAGVVVDEARLAPARGSIVEGYTAAVLEAERAAAKGIWEYPSCAVRLDASTTSFVAGYPVDDGDALTDWAARVALAASRDGVKRAFIGGPDAARAELVRAFSLVGIALPERLEEKASWLRLPFWKSPR